MQWDLDRRRFLRSCSATIDEKGRASEAEEQHVDRDDIIEDGAELSPEGDERRKQSLQRDRRDGHAAAGTELPDLLEEDPVPRHGVIDSRRGEHALTEKSH